MRISTSSVLRPVNDFDSARSTPFSSSAASVLQPFRPPSASACAALQTSSNGIAYVRPRSRGSACAGDVVAALRAGALSGPGMAARAPGLAYCAVYTMFTVAWISTEPGCTGVGGAGAPAMSRAIIICGMGGGM